jgi:glycosyltransferase involved in cell wall biosynthesis
MIEKMLEYFSSEIDYKVVDCSDPESDPRRSLLDKVDFRLLGGLDVAEILKFRPDIIYSDADRCVSQFKMRLWTSSKRIPHIMHLRGDPWREYWSWFSQVGWRSRVYGLQRFYSIWHANLAARRITPICRWLDTIVNHYLPTKRTEVVYQGVDPDEFYEERGFGFCRPSVAIIQKHTILPKVLGLLNFRRVVERLPEVHFYITEGYAGAQDYLGIVKQQFSKLTNVTFVPGANSSSWVRRMLTATDCYILASGLDACPTTVLEASLMRKPVIASRIGGVPELVLEGRTGWTIENDSVEDWVNKIQLVLKDPKLSRRLGEAGRKWVSSQFAWARIAKQVENILLREGVTAV